MAQDPVQLNIKSRQTWPREACPDHRLQGFPQRCQAQHVPHPHTFLSTSRDRDSTLDILFQSWPLTNLILPLSTTNESYSCCPHHSRTRWFEAWIKLNLFESFFWSWVFVWWQGQAGFRVTCELGGDSNHSALTSHWKKFQKLGEVHGIQETVGPSGCSAYRLSGLKKKWFYAINMEKNKKLISVWKLILRGKEFLLLKQFYVCRGRPKPLHSVYGFIGTHLMW